MEEKTEEGRLEVFIREIIEAQKTFDKRTAELFNSVANARVVTGKNGNYMAKMDDQYVMLCMFYDKKEKNWKLRSCYERYNFKSEYDGKTAMKIILLKGIMRAIAEFDKKIKGMEWKGDMGWYEAEMLCGKNAVIIPFEEEGKANAVILEKKEWECANREEAQEKIFYYCLFCNLVNYYQRADRPAVCAVLGEEEPESEDKVVVNMEKKWAAAEKIKKGKGGKDGQ